MRRLKLAALISLAVVSPAIAGQPSLRVSLPADHTDALRRGGWLIVRGYRHADPFPLTLVGTAEGFVNGARRSIPLTFVRDTLEGHVLVVMKNWPDEGPWVLNIGAGYDSTRMWAGVVVGVSPRGQPVLVQNPRTAVGGTRQATRREVTALLAHLAGDRAEAPALVTPRWRAVFTPPGIFTAGVFSLPLLLVGLIVRRDRKRKLALSPA